MEQSSDQGRFSRIKILDPSRNASIGDVYVTTPCSNCMMACIPSATIPLHGWMIVSCTVAVSLKINFARLQGGFVRTPSNLPGYGPGNLLQLIIFLSNSNCNCNWTIGTQCSWYKSYLHDAFVISYQLNVSCYASDLGADCYPRALKTLFSLKLQGIAGWLRAESLLTQLE